MIVKLLTEHHLEFLSLKGSYRGSSESTQVKMPHCSKSNALAHVKDLATRRWHKYHNLKFWLKLFTALRFHWYVYIISSVSTCE